MDELLAERDTVNRRLAAIIDEGTEIPWGVKVETVEIKDVSLPEGMKRSMSRQAEAERERRARIITADGEFQASKRLAAAANVMARDPAALQLRLLQTVVEVAGERNSTLVMPVPVELLRFFDRFTPGSGGSGAAAEPDAAAEPRAAGDEEVKALESQAKTEAHTLADTADAEIEQPTGPAAISGVSGLSLDIPDVPDIPKLSPEEKGDLGTVHHGTASQPDDGSPSAADENGAGGD
jgi:regulator of protease activity HflC (stomatin/prohibitin superfamily)